MSGVRREEETRKEEKRKRRSWKRGEGRVFEKTSEPARPLFLELKSLDKGVDQKRKKRTTWRKVSFSSLDCSTFLSFLKKERRVKDVLVECSRFCCCLFVCLFFLLLYSVQSNLSSIQIKQLKQISYGRIGV